VAAGGSANAILGASSGTASIIQVFSTSPDPIDSCPDWSIVKLASALSSPIALNSCRASSRASEKRSTAPRK
jgi:hypothetical protein